MKTFVFDYHRNNTTTLLLVQIQIYSVCPQILPSEDKDVFSVLNVQGLVIFQNRAQMQLIAGMRGTILTPSGKTVETWSVKVKFRSKTDFLVIDCEEGK